MTCQADPALVKSGPNVRSVSLTLCLVAAGSPGWVCRRPRLAGMRQDIESHIIFTEVGSTCHCHVRVLYFAGVEQAKARGAMYRLGPELEIRYDIYFGNLDQGIISTSQPRPRSMSLTSARDLTKGVEEW